MQNSLIQSKSTRKAASNKFISSLVFLFLSTSSFFAKAEVVDKILAIVNNEVILQSDLDDFKAKLAKPQFLDDNLFKEGTTVEQLKNSRELQMDYLVNEFILKSKIKEKGLTATPDRIDLEIKDLTKKGNLSQADLENLVKKQGMTLTEFRAFQKEKMEKQALLDSEVISKLRITDDELLTEYLKSNPKNKPQTDEFTLAHIFFNPKKQGAAAAKERADAVLKKLTGGDQFDKLAEQFSEDPNFSAGGALGTFKTGEFIPEIETAVRGLKDGETTQVVKSKLGYHIVKVVGHKQTVDPQFLKAKDRIKNGLLEKAFSRTLKQWLKTIRAEAYIRINA